jgi:hypothetical protein
LKRVGTMSQIFSQANETPDMLWRHCAQLGTLCINKLWELHTLCCIIPFLNEICSAWAWKSNYLNFDIVNV